MAWLTNAFFRDESASITSDSRKASSTVLLRAVVKRDVNARRFEIVNCDVVIFRYDKWHVTFRAEAFTKEEAREDLKKTYCIRCIRQTAQSYKIFPRFAKNEVFCSFFFY